MVEEKADAACANKAAGLACKPFSLFITKCSTQVYWLIFSHFTFGIKIFCSKKSFAKNIFAKFNYCLTLSHWYVIYTIFPEKQMEWKGFYAKKNFDTENHTFFSLFFVYNIIFIDLSKMFSLSQKHKIQLSSG